MKHARTSAAAVLAAIATFSSAHANAATSETCTPGNAVLSARTPQVDLFDAPPGKVVLTLDGGAFPTCVPIIGRAANAMLEIKLRGEVYWVAPYQVRYRFEDEHKTGLCSVLASGSNQEKVGTTRGLGGTCHAGSKSGAAKASTAKRPPVDPCENLAVRDKPCPDKPE